VAKKVFPIYLDKKHRQILEALSARDNISMAEAARRIIGEYKIDIIAPPGAHELRQAASH
jgi:DNA-binding FadR family transcriptional regulator